MTTFHDLLNWAPRFRLSRKSISSGRPLWAYKVTDDELFELQSLLADLASKHNIRTIINQFEGPYAEAFVMFASTWLQRNSAGRPKWDPVLDAVNATAIDQANRMSLVEKGLRKWGLSVYSTDTSVRYLDSLACQGGFPRSDLLQQSASHIMDYFVAVLTRYERYQHFETLDTLAIESLRLLPITLQQTAFATLVTQLIECLLEWKSHYDLGNYKDAVKVLDNENPNWRQELPFLVLDEEAQTLINQLLKRASQFKRRELNPIRIKRQLVPLDKDYRLIAEIYIAHEIHSEDLMRQLGNQTLPRSFFISTNANDSSRFRTASFTLMSGANAGWKVSTYHSQVKNSVALGELNFSLDTDGRQFYTGTYYRGEALADNVPWVFESSGSVLSYIGQGSIKTKRDRLAVVSKNSPVPATPISTAKSIGGLIGTSLEIYEVTGEVDVVGLSGNYRVSCNSGASEEFIVRIEAEPYHELNAKHPIFLGTPTITCTQSDETTHIDESELFWYQRASKTLKPLYSKGVIGKGIIVWRRKQTVLWEKPVIILPEHFEYRLIHVEDSQFSLVLRNALQPKFGLCEGYENWVKSAPSYEANELRASIQHQNEADTLGVTLMWDENPDTECVLEIPISFNSATLVDRQGNVYRELEQGELTINELANLRVRIRTDADIQGVQVVAHLFGPPKNIGSEFPIMKRQVGLDVECNQGLSFVKGPDLSDLSKMLFNHADELDSSIRLAIYAGGIEIPNSIPRIKRYKHDPKFVDDRTAVTLKATPALMSVEFPHLFLSPIWDFDRDPIEITPEDASAHVWRFNLPPQESVEYGSWLIWATPEMSVHPRIKQYPIPTQRRDPTKLSNLGAQLLGAFNNGNHSEAVYEERLVEGSLPYKVKYLDPSNQDSMKSLNKSVRNMGFDIDHKGWAYIDGLMKRIDAIEPLALYAMTSMQRNQGALAGLLFRDRQNFSRAWDLADRLGVSWYQIPVKIWLSVIRQYFEKYQKLAEPIREMGEDVYWEMVYKQFASFEAKGPYFKYLVDLATDRPCFEPVAIWENDELIKNGLDNQTVGALFRRERTALFDRHKGELMSRIGPRRETQYFLRLAEEHLPTLNGLPSELNGFIKYTIAQESEYQTKQDAWSLTLRLPLQLGWYVSNLYKPSYNRKFLMLLRYVTALLDEFDREWLQTTIMLSHMACSILELENPQPLSRERG